MNKTQSGWGGGAGRHLRPSAVGTFWSFSAESQPAGHLKKKCVSLELSELEAAAQALLFSSPSFLFLVVPVDVKALPKATSCLGGGWRLVFCLALPSTSKSLGKPLVNRLKPGV